jgi:hypothetical protein
VASESTREWAGGAYPYDGFFFFASAASRLAVHVFDYSAIDTTCRAASRMKEPGIRGLDSVSYDWNTNTVNYPRTSAVQRKLVGSLGTDNTFLFLGAIHPRRDNGGIDQY